MWYDVWCMMYDIHYTIMIYSIVCTVMTWYISSIVVYVLCAIYDFNVTVCFDEWKVSIAVQLLNWSYCRNTTAQMMRSPMSVFMLPKCSTLKGLKLCIKILLSVTTNGNHWEPLIEAGQTVFGEGDGAIYLGMLAVGDPIDQP